MAASQGYTSASPPAPAKSAVEIAAEAAVDKKGWRLFNGKVLLCQATKKYKRAVTIPVGSTIPWNETSDFYKPGGDDHWFEVGPFSTPKIQSETGLYIPGRLFTTRMPRGLDKQAGEYTEDSPEVDPKYTDKRRFIQKVKDNQIKCAIVLVEDEEMPRGESSDLLDFYRSLGIEVHHTPICDFSTPSFETEADNIALLCTNLAKGVNSLVHCWGGSGRTGTVVIGAVHNFGIKNSIAFGRKAKSVYLDIKEQEEFVEKQRLIVNTKMMEDCPTMAHELILSHIDTLCGKLDHPEAEYVHTAHGAGSDSALKVALQDIFDHIDVHGHEVISVADKHQFAANIKASHPDKTFHHITESNLHKLYGKMDASILDCAVDEDCITFDHFHKVIHTNVTLQSIANEKKNSGFV